MEAVQFFHAWLVKVPITVVPLSELGNVYDKMSEGKIVGWV